MLYHPVKHPGKLIIECKWQQIAGSVDEKYPYTVQNIRERYPCRTIILLDGNGYKPGAKEWLCSQVDDKLLAVFSMSEFQTVSESELQSVEGGAKTALAALIGGIARGLVTVAVALIDVYIAVDSGGN